MAEQNSTTSSSSSTHSTSKQTGSDERRERVFLSTSSVTFGIIGWLISIHAALIGVICLIIGGVAAIFGILLNLQSRGQTGLILGGIGLIICLSGLAAALL